MRRIAFGLLPLLMSCSVGNEPSAAANVSPIVVADYSIAAFDGHLSGVDRGEFQGGGLYYQERDGTRRRILEQNVRGMTRSANGIFVFTGLAHMHTNEGYVYSISRTPVGQIRATLLARLAGSPGQVQEAPDGTVSFLVYTGRFSGNRPVFDCFALSGSSVTPSHNCRPPKQGL